MVEETVGQAAIERGPLVYCCESADTHASTLDDIYLDLNAEFVPVEFEIEGRKMTALETCLLYTSQCSVCFPKWDF